MACPGYKPPANLSCNPSSQLGSHLARSGFRCDAGKSSNLDLKTSKSGILSLLPIHHIHFITTLSQWQQLPAHTTRKSTRTARSLRTPRSTALARTLLETKPSRAGCPGAASSLQARLLTLSLRTRRRSTTSAKGKLPSSLLPSVQAPPVLAAGEAGSSR